MMSTLAPLRHRDVVRLRGSKRWCGRPCLDSREAVVKAPPDGYTLLSVGAAAATSATLYDRILNSRHRAGCGDQPRTRTTARRAGRRVAVVPPFGEARLEPEIAPFGVAILLQLAEESLHRRQRQGPQYADAHVFL